MALLANGFRLFSHNPVKTVGSGSAGTLPTSGQQPFGVQRMPYDAQATIALNRLGANPTGSNGQRARIMPRTAGNMAAKRGTGFELDATATLAGGVNIVGSASMEFTASGTAQLIAALSGTATMSMTATGTLAGALYASGSFAAALSTTASMGAIAYLTGAASMSMTATSTIMGIGYLEGSFSSESAALTTNDIAAAVWAAVATVNNDAGSMGELLNDAGVASNPWTENIETGLTAKQAMKLIAAAVAGELSGADSATITIRNAVADSKNRIVATVDDNGNRTAITYDLSD